MDIERYQALGYQQWLQGRPKHSYFDLGNFESDADYPIDSLIGFWSNTFEQGSKEQKQAWLLFIIYRYSINYSRRDIYDLEQSMKIYRLPWSFNGFAALYSLEMCILSVLSKGATTKLEHDDAMK